MALIERYWHEVRGEFERLPVWLPGTVLTIGDVGTLKPSGWTRETSLADLGIQCKARLVGAPTNISYCSHQGAELRVQAAGSVGSAVPGLIDGHAGIHASFTRGSAFLLLAEDVKTYQLEDTERINDELLHRYDAGTWRSAWIVVSEVSLGAPVLTVIAGDDGGAVTVDLGASAGPGPVALADAGTDLRLGYTKGLQASFVTRENCAVLWRGRHVQDPLLRQRRIADRGPADRVDAAAGTPAVAELEYLRDIEGWANDPGQSA
jgi:hypothetical protein